MSAQGLKTLIMNTEVDGELQHLNVQISVDVLSSMVRELVADFEQHKVHESVDLHWISDSGATQVFRYGSSPGLHHVLNQDPTAVVAEYELHFCSESIFSWTEYLWPHLQPGETKRHSSRMVLLPKVCADELWDFHKQADTQWLARYKELATTRRCVQIDEIGIVTEPNRVEFL